MANNISQLKTDIRTAFGANLDATTRTDLLARFVTKYPAEWAAFLAVPNVDNATNRGIFATNMLFDKYLNDEIYSNEGYRAAVQAATQAVVRTRIE